jgi:hypothetical protein
MEALETMERKMVGELKKGEYLRRSQTAKKTYQRGDYDRSSKMYSLIDCDDMNREILVNYTAPAFIGFTY